MGNLCRAAQCDDQLAVNDRQLAPATIRPPFDPRASTETPCSISPALRTPTGATLNDDATAKLGGPTGCSGIAKDRDACHAACKKQSGDQSVSRTSMVALSLRQCVEQGLRLLEIAGVEAFAEAPIDR